MSRRKEEVVAILARAFGPFIGDSMVRASVNGHWDKLGLGLEADDEGMKRLLAALGPGLNVFVGRRKGEALVQTVEEELRGAPAGAGGRP